ncbi:MAG: hypothetical protein EPO26_03660 [Chloroflexota bacterium]|nr:MAG: hypothetical protein EPO26_03660 [Chloroflexota bacterium]
MRNAEAASARIETYLSTVRECVEEALRARRALLSDLLQTRVEPELALDRAGRASRRCVRAFADALFRIDRASTPGQAAECTTELRAWLAAHVEACDLLTRAAMTRNRDDFDRALRRLTAGSLHAESYNRARTRLVRMLAAA